MAKRHILTKVRQEPQHSLHRTGLQDSEQQMILTARRSLVQKMARHQTPQIEIFFLNILGGYLFLYQHWHRRQRPGSVSGSARDCVRLVDAGKHDRVLNIFSGQVVLSSIYMIVC